MSRRRRVAWGLAITLATSTLTGCRDEDAGRTNLLAPMLGGTGGAGGTSPPPGDGGSGGTADGGGGATPPPSDAAGEVAPPVPDADPPPANPCMGIPAHGECASPSQVRFCAIPTGFGSPMPSTINCTASEACQIDAGVAKCLPKPGACPEGRDECVDPKTIRTCANATWVTTACPYGCEPTGLGDHCLDATATVPYHATIKYEVRKPNSMLTDWDTTTTNQPANELLILSRHGTTILDSTYTGADGTFTIKVPATLAAGDTLAVVPVHANAELTGIAFAVGLPDVADGMVDPDPAPPGKPGLWNWSVDLTKVMAGSEVVISEAMGSGVIQVHQYLRAAYKVAVAAFGNGGKPLVAWVRLNTSWSCGSCFIGAPATISALKFDSQIFFGADTDRAYWSNAVTAHELGHWVMESFSVAPDEGGEHCLSHTSFPGLSWSEGWATAFSSLVRSQPIYYDKQRGSMFWFDLTQRSYVVAAGKVIPFTRPTPAGGLLQRTDENEIAAMVYGLAQDQQIGTPAVLNALAAIKKKARPFARGYTQHVWPPLVKCEPVNATDTHQSSPMFADFLDALRCQDIPAAAVDRVIQPAMYYPYPSATPICQ